jgi:hypothetical protein
MSLGELSVPISLLPLADPDNASDSEDEDEEEDKEVDVMAARRAAGKDEAGLGAETKEKLERVCVRVCAVCLRAHAWMCDARGAATELQGAVLRRRVHQRKSAVQPARRGAG